MRKKIQLGWVLYPNPSEGNPKNLTCRKDAERT
jgi:hypothetical protein